MSFYPASIQILSRFHLDFNQILASFYPDFILILARFYLDFILILLWFYPDFILIFKKLLWEKIVLVIKKNFWNSRLEAENLEIFWYH
jgi:hypothetical protein